jgi:hypothetical protein
VPPDGQPCEANAKTMLEDQARDVALKAIKALDGLVKTISTRYQHRDLDLFRPCQLLIGHLGEAHLWLDGKTPTDPSALVNILGLLESICKVGLPRPNFNPQASSQLERNKLIACQLGVIPTEAGTNRPRTWTTSRTISRAL